jgi:DNA-binding NarL/FixJ family response regulator
VVQDALLRVKKKQTVRAKPIRQRADISGVPAKPKLRIVLVDDHPVIREQLAEIINREPDVQVCGVATTRAEAVEVIGKLRPDMAVVDLTLPDARGVEVVKELHEHAKDVKLLVLTMHEESLYGPRAIRSGARGYIDKGRASSQVLVAIRKVLGGEVYLSDELAQLMASSVAGTNAGSLEPIDRLGERELEVFERIGDGQSIDKIARAMKLSYKTIETYRVRIRRKLNLPDAAALRRNAIIWVSRYTSS